MVYGPVILKEGGVAYEFLMLNEGGVAYKLMLDAEGIKMKAWPL